VAKWLQLLETSQELAAVTPSSMVPLWKWAVCTWNLVKASFCHGHQRLWMPSS